MTDYTIEMTVIDSISKILVALAAAHAVQPELCEGGAGAR